jgi:hypothetical protein
VPDLDALPQFLLFEDTALPSTHGQRSAGGEEEAAAQLQLPLPLVYDGPVSGPPLLSFALRQLQASATIDPQQVRAQVMAAVGALATIDRSVGPASYQTTHQLPAPEAWGGWRAGPTQLHRESNERAESDRDRDPGAASASAPAV